MKNDCSTNVNSEGALEPSSVCICECVSAAGTRWRCLRRGVQSQKARSQNPAGAVRSPSPSPQRSRWTGNTHTHTRSVLGRARYSLHSGAALIFFFFFYSAQDDPVAGAVFNFCSEVWRQVVFIDVTQKFSDWTQHHYLQRQDSQRWTSMSLTQWCIFFLSKYLYFSTF